MGLNYRYFCKIVSFFVIFAFFVQAVIPRGFMPDIKTSETLSLVICSAQGSVASAKSDISIPSQSHDKKDTCPFSFYSSAKTLGTLFINLAFSIVFEPLSYIRSNQKFQHVSYSLFSSRGPPFPLL